MPVLLALAMAAATAPDSDALIARLGPNSDYRSVEAIARGGCKAVPALVRQLGIGSTRVIHFSRPDAPVREFRILWSLATLRYITGRDFHAKRTGTFDRREPRDDMLTMGAPRGKTKLFGIWMSRGAVYFARPAEQAVIIRQWRRFSARRSCREGRSNRDPDFWLYGVRERRPGAGHD